MIRSLDLECIHYQEQNRLYNQTNYRTDQVICYFFHEETFLVDS